MKKKLLCGIMLLTLAAMTAISFSGCGGKLTDEESAIIGMYTLTSLKVEGLSENMANSYEYYTMEFLKNRKCAIQYKAGKPTNSVTEYEAVGSWRTYRTYDQNFIEVIIKDGNTTVTEFYKRTGNLLTGTDTTTVGGVSLKTTAIFAQK